MSSFAHQLIRWQKQHGRHDLPWQGADAYRVWLSEIMLQQTQVATVIPYYQRFVASFPNIAALAAATEDQVLAHWSGLGYYARGRNLHKAAQIIVEKHHGEFPHELEQILELPGIGRSTAAAVCALAFHQRRAILDGNVKRVLARYCGIEGWAGEKKVEEKLWRQAEALLPEGDVATYTQALMDMGATICTRSKPKCVLCPVQADCVALQTDRIADLPTPRPRKLCRNGMRCSCCSCTATTSCWRNGPVAAYGADCGVRRSLMMRMRRGIGLGGTEWKRVAGRGWRRSRIRLRISSCTLRR